MNYLNRTRIAYVMTRIVDIPFWAIYNLLQVILYKSLHASPLQITVMIALKPLVSLFSFYWSSFVHQRRDRLLSHLIWGRLLSFLPFFFFPFIQNVWFVIFSFGLYMMLTMATLPAWMEILKLNLPNAKREKVFSYAQACGYMGGGLLPFLFGFWLDGTPDLWRFIFPAAALLSLSALIFQMRILIPKIETEEKVAVGAGTGDILTKPWRSAWHLLKENSDFRHFQIGSMIMGSALMIMQPALLFFFVDSLQLSYVEIAMALACCKGVGFALASPLWPRFMRRFPIFLLSGSIALLATLFPLILYGAQWHLIWLYLGYLCYGVMQSGNELVWNLSGTVFAGHRDSSPFTSMNVLAGGVRGACVPAMGSFLALTLGATTVMGLSAFLCVVAATHLFRCGMRLQVIKIK